jgi:hypothetical protein
MPVSDFSANPHTTGENKDHFVRRNERKILCFVIILSFNLPYEWLL